MTVASRLRAAFAAYLLLLAVVLAFQIRATQRSADATTALAALSNRLRSLGDAQLARVEEAHIALDKFAVTGDSGYAGRVADILGAYGSAIERMDSLALTAVERERVTSVIALARSASFGARSIALSGADSIGVARLRRSIEDLAVATYALRQSTQDAMTREVGASEAATHSAARISLALAASAIALTIVLSILLVRAIVRPLGTFASAAREIAAGRLGYRLPEQGGGHRRDELSAVARDFNSMAERLETLDRMKREFVSNVSHDLKTPLSSMQETTAALLDGLPGPLTEQQRRLLMHQRESGRRLSGMVTKLLDAARQESQVPPRCEVVDGVALIHAAVSRARAMRPIGHTCAIVADTPDDMPLRVDAAGMESVLDNLLENAVRFSPSAGRVRVSLGRGEDGVLITVADEGPGIPNSDKQTVFDRFHQTQLGRAARSHGVGLGLSICKGVVERHGGRIDASDNSPRGTVMSIHLPPTVLVGAVGRREGAAA